jgi:hypothetical protein
VRRHPLLRYAALALCAAAPGLLSAPPLRACSLRRISGPLSALRPARALAQPLLRIRLTRPADSGTSHRDQPFELTLWAPAHTLGGRAAVPVAGGEGRAIAARSP